MVDPAPARRAASRPVQPARDKDGARIVARNLFCSHCPDLLAKSQSERQRTAADQGPHKSGLPLALGAVVIAADDTLSLAVIRDLSKPKPPARWFRRGEAVFASIATVVRVAERRVYLRVGDKTEYLDLSEPIQPTASATAGTAHVFAKTDALSAEIDHGVRCSGTSCEIDRPLVEHLLANTSALAMAARFVPVMQNGRADGFRVNAIRRGSLFEKLGMLNGDRIITINGLPIATPDQALDLYTKLRRASHLTMQLDRRGSTTTLDYTIR
jgi:general secretion pathway protein C